MLVTRQKPEGRIVLPSGFFVVFLFGKLLKQIFYSDTLYSKTEKREETGGQIKSVSFKIEGRPL